ncbi:MAG: hypothetical protein JWN62_2645 [Acidimicrobiales bacterium]|nr:hypothetical protein [Acidimicrobiales bacterium]
MDPQRSPRRPPGPPARRRPSRRTFLIRRVVVLVVAIAIVAGLVTVVKGVLSSDTSTASSPPAVTATTTPVLPQGSVAVLPSDPAATATTVLDASTTITPTSDPSTVPTAADPARVLLVGDSEAGGLSPFLSKVLDTTGVVALTTDYKVSSGFVRPDFFDWPAHLQQSVPVSNPDIVIAVFGGNDGQSFLAGDAAAGAAANKAVDSAEWRAEYAKRIGSVMDFLTAGGRTLVWVGVPNAEKDSLTAALTVQNEVVKSEIAKRPKVVFVDSWHTFTGIDGGFAPLILDPRDGQFKPVRSDTDGFHLNTTGEEILAYLVGGAVFADLKARGAAI